MAHELEQGGGGMDLDSTENPSPLKGYKKVSIFGDQDAGVRTMSNVDEVDLVKSPKPHCTSVS
jgi:hypothetical protein